MFWGTHSALQILTYKLMLLRLTTLNTTAAEHIYMMLWPQTTKKGTHQLWFWSMAEPEPKIKGVKIKFTMYL